MQYEFIAKHCICCNSDNLKKSSAILMPFIAKRVFGHEPLEITSGFGLRDLQLGMAYTLCNSLQCQVCGVVFLDYRFTDEQMAVLYHGYRDEVYTQQRDHYEPGYAAIAGHYQGRASYLTEVETWLTRYLPKCPSVLDWGGGTGLNTPFLDRHKLLHIYDISGVELVAGAERVNPKALVRGFYDLVVCSQVLEHVPSPRATIEQMVSVLGPQTLLYVEVPHEALIRDHPGSLELASLKHHWHEHINFFNQRALSCLLNAAGLDVLDCQFLTINLGSRQAEVMGVLARRP